MLKSCILFALCAYGSSAELRDEFKKLHPDGGKREGAARLGHDNNGITEIAVERTPCLGSCPVYSARLTSDGDLFYDGVNFVTKKGQYTARIGMKRFNGLAEILSDTRFMDYADSYDDGAMDVPGMYVKIVRDGKTKVVYASGEGVPLELLAIGQAIDGCISEAVLVPKK